MIQLRAEKEKQDGVIEKLRVRGRNSNRRIILVYHLQKEMEKLTDQLAEAEMAREETEEMRHELEREFKR